MIATLLDHEKFCGPAVDQDEPRIERYSVPRYADDGTTRVASVSVVRCLECGSATYDGVQKA